MSPVTKTLFSIVLLIGLIFAPAWAADQRHTILAIQHQTFEPFSLSYQGFVEGIEKLGYKDKIKLEHFNAKGDLKALDQKIEALSKSKDVDLIFSIGTQTTTRVKKHIKNIPFIFTDLGDPVYSGIVSDWKSSGANYTGVETPGYISLQIGMIHELAKFNSIGMIYLAGSPSHDAGIKQIKNLSKELGLKFVYEGFPLRDKNRKRYPKELIQERIQECLDKVLPQVEVLFIQISKTFDIHFPLFRKALLKYQKLSVGEPIYIKRGIIMGIGRDKRVFGGQCAEYAVKILEGANPSDLPMDIGVKFTIVVNLQAAIDVGYDPPVDLLGAADEVYQELEIEKP